jgi:hypothetical protein
MRLYNRADFLKLPSGVLFCSGEPYAFGNLRVKGESLGYNDFVALELQTIDSAGSGDCIDRLDEMLHTGASYPMNADYGRDGAFDQAEVFLVWERADLAALEAIVLDAMGVVSKLGDRQPSGSAPKS